MRFMDMLRMSASNLWKRKTRTILTILGVVIGTASIVVMISIGLGLDKATMEQMESYGSMTTIEVYSNGGWYDPSSSTDPTENYLSDETVKLFEGIDHVSYVSPVLNLSAIGLMGKYQGWLNIYGMSLEALEAQGMEAEQGRLPSAEDDELTFFFGNNVREQFYIKKSYTYYWEDPSQFEDLDLMNGNLFIVFDQDAYYQSEYDSSVAKPKKYIIPAVGIERANSEEYQRYNYQVYCDIDQLIVKLKQVFKNKPIPGQPTTKAGKPYKEFYYNNIVVNVDSTDHVTEVQQQITDMGYQANSNMEWVEYAQKQYEMVQAVLGGIGAVALIVAAISIANTMTMSIYERTKEIGVMKVLGCNMHNIQGMFLLEAAFIGFIGGVVGAGLSYAASAFLNHYAMQSESGFMGIQGEMSFIPPWLFFLGIGFAVVVGTLAGFFPSLRAMRLSPLAAIRNE